jgi:hypothetical protein
MTTMSNTKYFYWLCPIYAFECGSECVDVLEGIQIRKITPEFTTYLEVQQLDWFWTNPSDSKYMFIFPSTTSSSGQDNAITGKWHRSDLLEGLTTAFRLCRRGMVSPGPLVLAELRGTTYVPQSPSMAKPGQFPPGTEIGPTLSSVSRDGADIFATPIYYLEPADIPYIKSLFIDLMKFRGRHDLENLNIALRRFNAAYHGNIEDRLIDHMIALESLYLGKDQELKYRLAIRAAYLLGTDKTRKIIFNEIKSAYDLRSTIVHGNKQIAESEIENVVDGTQEYVRKSIRRFLILLKEGYSMRGLRQGNEKTMAKLEENILSNGVLLAEKPYS